MTSTYLVGKVASLSFYRTNIATQSAAETCRSGQVSQGTYDVTTNRTYIAYSAGFAGTEPTGRPAAIEHQYTAENPTIMAYDHGTHTWEGPIEIFNVRGLPGATSDCHNYPQVVIGTDGLLHIFHTLHNSGINIQHFVSERPHDIRRWRRQEIPGTSYNTYGAAFKNNEGHLYVFYRATLPRVPVGFYEPEMYVKSTDSGATWCIPKLLIDPGRPSTASGVAAEVTNLLNDGGWNTIYVVEWAQDHKRNRLMFDFVATYNHGEQFGNRNLVYFDMSTDTVHSLSGVNFGQCISRTKYLGNKDVVLYEGRWVASYMKNHGLAPRIAFEDEARGYPTVYYSVFENTEGLTPDDPVFYEKGLNRLKRARWDGAKWVHAYLSGTSDPRNDPFVQWHEIPEKRRDVAGIWDAEYRGAEGTFLYIETLWGGKQFWLDADGAQRPEYDWDKNKYNYQYPTRVFNTNWGWNTSIMLFADHPEWELRGVSNFTLIPGAHPSIRAFMKVPQYDRLRPSSGASFWQQCAIGSEYVWGERSL